MKCTFCGKEIPRGTGKMYVKKDARILYFCSMKCEKNLLKLHRKPRTTEWTNEYHNIKKGIKRAEDSETDNLIKEEEENVSETD
jgi:large subunit ribosomal protein L24e